MSGGRSGRPEVGREGEGHVEQGADWQALKRMAIASVSDGGPNNSMQRTALRAAADAERQAPLGTSAPNWARRRLQRRTLLASASESVAGLQSLPDLALRRTAAGALMRPRRSRAPLRLDCDMIATGGRGRPRGHTGGPWIATRGRMDAHGRARGGGGWTISTTPAATTSSAAASG